MRVLLGTANPGKVREFRRMLAGPSLEVVTPADLGFALEVAEEGDTYAANATAKARAYASAGGCWALADDSGIEVDALNGRPGLYSARYGTPDLDDAGRTRLLLREMAGVPGALRSARYRAVVAVCSPRGDVRTFEGVMEGAIGTECRGARGFGYDPVFMPSPPLLRQQERGSGGEGRTAAELSDDQKDRISHRGIAVRAAAVYLREVAARCG